MDGKIEVLATEGQQGRVITKKGETTSSYAYDVQAGGLETLAPGQLVTFELAPGNPDSAVEIRARKNGESSAGVEKRRPEVRYEGFEQTEGIRTFRFQAHRRGEENQEAVVTVELALLRRHGITLQEGPGLCLRLLEAELQENAPDASGVWSRALTDKEMLVHLAARPQGKKRS